MSGYVSVAAISICLFFSCAQVKKVQQQEPLPTAIPTLRILHDTAASAIRIWRVGRGWISMVYCDQECARWLMPARQEMDRLCRFIARRVRTSNSATRWRSVDGRFQRSMSATGTARVRKSPRHSSIRANISWRGIREDS